MKNNTYIFKYILENKELILMKIHNSNNSPYTFNYKQMNEVYYTFHTQDPEWCIQSLLDLNNITSDIFDNNYRLKHIIKMKEKP